MSSSDKAENQRRQDVCRSARQVVQRKYIVIFGWVFDSIGDNGLNGGNGSLGHDPQKKRRAHQEGGLGRHDQDSQQQHHRGFRCKKHRAGSEPVHQTTAGYFPAQAADREEQGKQADLLGLDAFRQQQKRQKSEDPIAAERVEAICEDR